MRWALVSMVVGIILLIATSLPAGSAWRDGAGTLMVIGHNPGMHDFALDILRDGGSLDHYASQRLAEKFPTSCVAMFEREDDGSFVPVLFRLSNVLRAKSYNFV